MEVPDVFNVMSSPGFRSRKRRDSWSSYLYIRDIQTCDSDWTRSKIKGKRYSRKISQIRENHRVNSIRHRKKKKPYPSLLIYFTLQFNLKFPLFLFFTGNDTSSNPSFVSSRRTFEALGKRKTLSPVRTHRQRSNLRVTWVRCPARRSCDVVRSPTGSLSLGLEAGKKVSRATSVTGGSVYRHGRNVLRPP